MIKSGLPIDYRRDPEKEAVTLLNSGTATEIETILAAARKLYGVLYCLLAGSGLRISEALGLEIGKHFSADCSIVYVRQQRSKKGHGIEQYPKTDAGIRDIDLAPALAAMVKKFIGNRTSGFLFETSGGLPMSPQLRGTACIRYSKRWDASW